MHRLLTCQNGGNLGKQSSADYRFFSNAKLSSTSSGTKNVNNKTKKKLHLKVFRYPLQDSHKIAGIVLLKIMLILFY
jgi:hypothetical protein